MGYQSLVSRNSSLRVRGFCDLRGVRLGVLPVMFGSSHGDAIMDQKTFERHFYRVTHERGRSGAALPTWADDGSGVVAFDTTTLGLPRRAEVPDVPRAFQLLDVLSDVECEQLIGITEAMGYHADSPVSLGHDIRHNHNVNWVVDASVDGPIWTRCAPLVHERVHGSPALGMNARFRFYRYRAGDYFKAHTDGAWPGSRVIDGNLHHDAHGDRESLYTILLFLSDGYEGGGTQFFVPQGEAPLLHTQSVRVSTPKGAALCFPHGSHPDHCVHAGEPVTQGTKYIIRSDILYSLRGRVI